MKAVTVLKRARKLLSNPERWTKGAFAKDRRGQRVPSGDPKAVCYCAAGALKRCAGNGVLWVVATSYLVRAARRGNYSPANVWYYNDHPRRTHAQVMRWFDRAIALAEKEAV